MRVINLNKENIIDEHVCCLISGHKDDINVLLKKDWICNGFKDGLVFKKIDARGKAFIEYIPAKNAWIPIIADEYLHVNCFWVSGSLKGNGYSNILLEECINDAKNKGYSGITVVSSTKKLPFLSDPKYLKYKGFIVADKIENPNKANEFFELLYLRFNSKSNIPSFAQCAKGLSVNEDGFVLFFTNQCPFSEKYALIIQDIAKKRGLKFKLQKIQTKDEAQNAPTIFTTYSLFYNGSFVTNEILSESKFVSLVSKFALCGIL